MEHYSDGNFESQISLEKMEFLLKLGREFAFDPTSSIESEEYFLRLLKKSEALDPDAQKDYLKAAVLRDFKVLDRYPDWIQNSDWQFNNGSPMTFVGQIETKIKEKETTIATVFYVFYDYKTGEIKTIVQYE